MKRLLARLSLALVAVLVCAVQVFSQTYTDNPLIPGTTTIKAVHITELRTAIASLRVTLGLPAFPYTDPTLTQQSTLVGAVHVNELRTALNDVFDMTDLGRPNYTDATLAGVTIKATHIQELRAGTIAIANLLAGCPPNQGALTNGMTHCGAVASASEVDTWTFTAAAGDRIAVHVGELTDPNDFRPWIRLVSPSAVVIGNAAGVEAAAIDGAVAPSSGVYQVQVASNDPGFDGTGIYRLTMTHTPGPIVIGTGDEGGPLDNGAMHTGRITRGDLDVWTFTAAANDRIAIHAGETSERDDFRPWIRVWAPNGAQIGELSGLDASAIDGAVAPSSGTYLVLVASFDSGFDGEGTYRLSMTHTPGPITVTAGDQGGPLTNGAMHSGEILQGDLDVWTFTAAAGDRIAVHVGEVSQVDDFQPWIRLWAPNGAQIGELSGPDAAAIDGAIAPVTGTYLVLVASFDAGFDGEGTYRLSMTHTPGPVTVTEGDQGGPLDNGAIHTGEILQGDLDVWTFTAAAGDRIAVHIGQLTDTDDFRPWIRLWAPNGAQIGELSGLDAAAINGAVAPATGTYLVLVASFDAGFDGEGTYRLTMTHTPGPIVVTGGDEGGPMENGALHTGTISQGDLDVWTFTATAGDRIAVHVGQLTDTDDFRPWIRLWAPNGAQIGELSGTDAAAIDGAVAPATGTYLVLVASFDAGFDGEGTYQLSMTHTPGPIVVTGGDDGGPMDNGALHTGTITQGDLDVWTFTANAGDRIAVHIGQVTDTDDFRPWIRLWAPNGTQIGELSGLDAAAIDGAIAPSSGTYLVLVASFDAGFDGEGTYRLSMTHTPGPITVTAGDQGGALTNGGVQNGEILQGDLDVWSITVPANNRITVTISETTDTDDFRPWIRLWAPNGVQAGEISGLSTAQITNAVAPVTGTYLVLVATFDPGFDGEGTYQLTVTHAPPPTAPAEADTAEAAVEQPVRIGRVRGNERRK
jgi:deoxycytidine triphosphate deaminase